MLLRRRRPQVDGRTVKRLNFTERFECPNDGTRAPTPTPQLFSFNSPRGACPTCNGFGAVLEYDEALIVPYPERSLREGAIDPWTKPRYDKQRRTLAEFARSEKIPLDAAVVGPSQTAQRDRLLQRDQVAGYTGILPFLRRPRGEAVQAVHPRLPASVPDRATSARPATAASSARRRCTCAWRAARSPRSRSCQWSACSEWLDDLVLSPFEQRGRAPHPARGPRRECGSCATSG